MIYNCLVVKDFQLGILVRVVSRISHFHTAGLMLHCSGVECCTHDSVVKSDEKEMEGALSCIHESAAAQPPNYL